MRIGCLAFALGLAFSASGAIADDAASNIVVARAYAPVSANEMLHRHSGSVGVELKLGQPQGHRIEFLKGGAARVAIWDGQRYLPRLFTAVESREGSKICLARTRAWTGGCLTIRSNGEDLRCGYLWNNGSSGETSCGLRPMRGI